MTAATVLVPRLTVAPRGAQLVGLVVEWLNRLAQQRRQRRALADVQAMREHAQRIQASDPGMAADLIAAADRHVV
jgi:hypothetical protein